MMNIKEFTTKIEAIANELCSYRVAEMDFIEDILIINFGIGDFEYAEGDLVKIVNHIQDIIYKFFPPSTISISLYITPDNKKHETHPYTCSIHFNEIIWVDKGD